MKLVLVLLAAACTISPVYPTDPYYSSYEPSLIPGLVAPYYADTLGPYPYVIGRQGIGFDKRTAMAHGFRVPMTPTILQVLRRHPTEKIGKA